MTRVTIEDVAKAAGVSRQTVSRAINDKGEISAATKDRVMQAVAELGYTPNRLAQGMVTRRTQTVGLVLADIANPFFPEVAKGVQELASDHGYNVFLCNTSDDPATEIEMLRSLAAQGVDGIILFAHMSSDEALRAFADTYGPIVLVNRIFEHRNVHLMMVDNLKGANLAARHLVERGHRTFGMLINAHHAFSRVRRMDGFQSEVERHGIEIPTERILFESATIDGGYAGAKALLTQSPEVTAIFAYNDLMALGAVRACHDLGREVPRDCAIVGFDDIQIASMTTPSLTTIRVDKYALGQRAMSRMLELIEAPTAVYPRIELDVDLVIRETT